MIIELCLTVFLRFLFAFFPAIGFSQSFMSGLSTVIDTVLPYFEEGAGVIATFTHFDYLLGLLSAVIAIKTFFVSVRFLNWVIKKIPFWGVR